MKRAKLLVTIAIALFGLAACGGNDEPENVVTPTPEPTNTIPMRTITDAVRDVSIPVTPERIVDISGNSDIMSIIGYDVVGTVNSDMEDTSKVPSYLSEALSNASLVGVYDQESIDLEAVIDKNPDLIIISTEQEEYYDRLSAYAPTVTVKTEGTDWKVDLTNVATVFGRTEEAKAWLYDYEKRATEVGAHVKEVLGETSTYLAFYANGEGYEVFRDEAIGSLLYNDMGLDKPAKLADYDTAKLKTLSLKEILNLGSDFGICTASDDVANQLKADKDWTASSLVTKNRLIVLPISPYLGQAYSSIGRLLLLDEIESALLELEPK